jgi:hypothetical protein
MNPVTLVARYQMAITTTTVLRPTTVLRGLLR